MSFYDWYCDLPPSRPQIWGEQTDVPESADWYNSSFIIAWGSNVPQTRTPDAHFFTEVRYKGAKTVVVTPDYSEARSSPTSGCTRSRAPMPRSAMAMGHVILKEFYFERGSSAYFDDYCRRYTDMPMLVLLKEHRTARSWCPTASARLRFRRRARPGQQPGMEDRGVRRRPARSCCRTARSASAGGERRRASGTWRKERATAGRWRLARRCLTAARQRHGGRGRLPLFRRPSTRDILQPDPRRATCWCARCRCSA